MDKKVYIVVGETIEYDDTYTAVAGVHLNEESAKHRMMKEIDSRCEMVKEQFMEQFNDEDYAEDYEDFETFEEFWADWVDNNFVTPSLWRYSDETDFTYIVYITQKELED